MTVAVLTVTLHLPWAHSLKDKLAEVKGLLAKIRAKFNVSAAEAGAQDAHQLAIFSVAALAANAAQADSMIDHVLCFIEAGTEAEVTAVECELR